MKKHLAYMIATCGGLGCSPVAPGTIGSIGSWLVLYFLQYIVVPPLLLWGIGGVSIFSGWWATQQVCDSPDTKDPSWIVIDEWVAVWFLLLCMPAVLWWQALAVMLFRVFDIVKPWPVSATEQLPGAAGIFADDITAAIITGAIMAAVLLAVG